MDTDAPLPTAVLWDMDDALVDTEPYWIRAEHELVEEFGGTWIDPADCVALEESPTGARSALAAGVPTLAVSHVVDVPATTGAVRLETLVGVTPFDLVALARGGRRNT